MLQTKMLHMNVPPQFHCGCTQSGNSELILASGFQITYDSMHVTLQRLIMLALLKAFGQEDTQILPSVPLGVKDHVCHEHSSIWQRLHVRNSFYQLQAVPPTGSGEWTQAGPSWLRKSLECELTASSLGGKLCENHIPVLEKPDKGVMRSHWESISASRSNWGRNSRISRHSKGEIKRCHIRNNIPLTRVRLREKHFYKKKLLYCL